MALEADDPILAVIAPPNVARFRALAGLRDDEAVTGNFRGWCKLVLLSDELAMLFPRDHTMSRFLDRELESLETIAPVGLDEAPAVVAIWDEPEVSPHRIVAVRRLPGTMLDERIDDISDDQLGAVLAQVARLAARWHVADPGPIAARPPRDMPQHVLVDGLLQRAGPTSVDLDLDAAERDRLARSLARVRELDHVLVHGDLHEGQLLVDDSLRVTGIIDWQTARVNHPFTEFDLGEWGTGTWRVHRRGFPVLRRRMWSAYASARGLSDDLADDFEIFWTVVTALRWPESPYAGNEVTGTFDEAMANVRQALRA